MKTKDSTKKEKKESSKADYNEKQLKMIKKQYKQMVKAWMNSK